MNERVLLTRPLADSLATMEKLSLTGHAAILSPVSVITPLEAPFPRTSACSAGILSSRNALRTLPESHRAFLRTALPFYVIGEKTAAEAREAGFTIKGAANENAAKLIENLTHEFPPGSALLHVCGVPSKPSLKEGLAQRRFQVYNHVVYKTEDVNALSKEALTAFRNHHIAGVLHYSRENARRFMDVMRRSPVPTAPASIMHFCISSDAAKALEGVPDAFIALAAVSTEEALLSRVTQRLQNTNGKK